MFVKRIIFLFGIVLFSVSISAQKDSIKVKKAIVKEKIEDKAYNPLAPSKAAFYSAIFPGMGQVYNKKYWKAPIVWGGLAISTYFYLSNNKEYKRFRTAFKLRKAGLVDEFAITDANGKVVDYLLSEEGLISAQKQLRENKDLSLLTTIIIYILQIVEASVNAHLIQFNTSDNLSFKPTIIPNPIQFDAPVVGLTIKYSF